MAFYLKHERSGERIVYHRNVASAIRDLYQSNKNAGFLNGQAVWNDDGTFVSYEDDEKGRGPYVVEYVDES